ncbi:AraC family transcriptional regulator [Fulvivirgaceae bacterium BMA12]|uniref:AraC family transcriptional regulator n=1 Tax=Agaribacillus aureus TaxID=3051825 RepID=A0ABT8L3H7_9BACT|nr:AraC family transcriptional regulator [Fulvivirgaceae bacterium BMA12]
MKAQFEKITTSRENSFKAFLYRDREFDAPWHYHPELELTYIVSSKGMRYVGDSIQKFEPGDLVLLGADLPHCWKNTGGSAGDASSIVIQWKENFLGEGWLQNPEFAAVNNLLTLASRGIKFGVKLTTEVEEMLFAILKESGFKRLIFLLEILNHLAVSSDYTLLSGDNFIANLNLEANDRINKVYNFVRENYGRKITLQEVASLVAMSEEAFCRFFKKTLNKSFFTFLNEYKVNLACKLLVETNYQVTRIAYECGYESLPYFYRQFQKFVHCSPASYKKEYHVTEDQR